MKQYCTASVDTLPKGSGCASLNELAEQGWTVVPGISTLRGTNIMVLMERDAPVTPETNVRTRTRKTQPEVSVLEPSIV